jgi:protein-tyrosine phosphatase
VCHTLIDLHCHVLAGIDDGPATIEQSIALARAASSTGTRTIVATPHVNWRYRNDSTTIAPLVRETNAALARAGVTLEVLAGAEIAATSVIDLTGEQLAGLTLGPGPWLLIECPFTSAAVGLDALLLDLHEHGFRVVLAHPERCPAFHRDRRSLESLVDAGALTSITAGSLTGRFGAGVQRFARALADAEMVHNVASDAHDADRRPPGIAAELNQAGLAALAGWLTEDVPGAILAGEQRLPARPAIGSPRAPSKRRLRLRRSLLRRA